MVFLQRSIVLIPEAADLDQRFPLRNGEQRSLFLPCTQDADTKRPGLLLSCIINLPQKPHRKQVNCTMKTIGTQVVMPLNVAKMIDENDPVFKMAEILSELDYRKLRGTYRRRWRSISPEIMFSIANMKGIMVIMSLSENRWASNCLFLPYRCVL